MTAGRFVLGWTSTTTEHHEAVVSAEQLATMLGTTVEAVLAGQTGGAIQDLGDRDLADGLADIEDSDTEVSLDGPYREGITIEIETTKENAS